MTAGSPRAPRRVVVRSGLAGLAVGGFVWVLLTGVGVTFPAASASATEDSAVTVKASDFDHNLGTAPMPDLAVTVSQTTDLTQQGITVSWTGGKRSSSPGGSSAGSNFLQIFECWGDDPKNPGRPDRTTCQYGGAHALGATRNNYRLTGVEDIPNEDLDFTIPSQGVFPPYTSIPFVARDGTVVTDVKELDGGLKVRDTANDINNNQFFTQYTTNEVTWAGSGAEGTGSIPFEIQTGAQSPGLGCGNALTAGSTAGASCWLVVLPRGVADNGSTTINQSGLFWDSWQHALAVKLDFRQIGSRCPVGAAERQLAGSELAALAVNSWQPVICNKAGGSIYSLLTLSESDSLMAANTTDDAPLALTSRALQTDGGVVDGLQYAPIALTGVTIAFAIDRSIDPFQSPPVEYADRNHLPFTSMNLTPRLIAKLLTDSYTRALPNGADESYLGSNPEVLTADPDFLAVNDPEWAYQRYADSSIADLLVPQGRSDAAWALWQYVLADPDAVAFLKGTPDPWGMVVNPWYSTSATVNRNGVALTLPRDDFVKADPVEVVQTPGSMPLNLVTWRAYANDLDTVGNLVLRGDGLQVSNWDPTSNPPGYPKVGRRPLGSRAVIGVSDFAVTQRYQVVTAALRNPAGSFVAPSVASVTAAAGAMTAAGAGGTVLAFDPSSAKAKSAQDAYPLAMPVYAAAAATIPDAGQRTAYADFIRYAVGDGQVSGSELGELPLGYAPIPSAWTAAALAAATKIAAGPTPVSSPDQTSNSPGADVPQGPSVPMAPEEPAQPDATGSPAPALSAGTTASDPKSGPTGSTVPISLLAGLAAALASAIAGRRKAIRTWIRR